MKLWGFYSEKQEATSHMLHAQPRIKTPGLINPTALPPRFDLYVRVADGARVRVTEVIHAKTEAEALALYQSVGDKSDGDWECVGEVVFSNPLSGGA